MMARLLKNARLTPANDNRDDFARQVAELAAANRWIAENHPLPRCEHGHALAGYDGERLEPPCACRLP